MHPLLRSLIASACLAFAAGAGAASLQVEVSNTRSQGDLDQLVQARVKSFARTAAALTHRVRMRTGNRQVFSLPVTVILTKNGQPLPVRSNTRAAGDLTLTFETAGSRAFSTTYRTLLQDTLTRARPGINAVFGQPRTAGAVKVLNYDADIQDRYAVSGGYFVPNAPGGPEIRFPVYNSTVSASINFVHCLLLAYRREAQLFSDAWNEGTIRAATMAVARSAGALPGSPSAEEVEQTLDSLYDASASYDWNNQSGLAAHPFIAPNLLNIPLPAGGSTGGPYLLRYQMAGTAWSKVITEHPGFLAEFNRRFNLAPASYPGDPELVILAQNVLNFLTGTTSGTVEGLTFSAWASRQAILDPHPSPGLKTVLQAFSIEPEAGTSDFGPFGLILHATRLQPNGDEILLSGRSYPVYWTPDNQRFFVSTQDDILEVAGGYGSVAPNFPRATFDGQAYRVIVDLPYQNRVSRAILPAGAIATGQNTTGNNVFGTLSSFPSLPAGSSYFVRVAWTGGSQDIPAVNFAFGGRIVEDSFSRAQSITVRVFSLTPGAPNPTVTEVANRRVSKGVGPLGLDLRPSSVINVFNLNRALRLFLHGMPLEPFRPEASSLLGLAPADTLAAFWNPRVSRYDLFPDESRLTLGQGFFHRSPSAVSRTVQGRLNTLLPTTVSLQPGWNAVSSPGFSSVPTTSVLAAPGPEFFSTYAEARGTILGTTFFRWVPDPGNGDLGTFQPATAFPPGEGVFVKCLRAEGAALAFLPVVIDPASRSARYFPAPQQGWEARITVAATNGHSSWVEVGQAPGGTRSADPRLDSDLPPSPGGLQARLQGSGVGFKDLRRAQGGEAWLADLEGLRPGQDYTLTVSFLRGSSFLQVEDLTLGTRRQTPRFGLSMKFRAISSTHRLRLWNGGPL